ncbi:hypothetical protein NQ314_013564 [Rhamnusium bicolor]|uniref:Cytokine-like nuclear factor N-PAC n=1 Tax=Rhamnusium bicolor TaxID=1586634 RepID=A0AAV8X590_9CUCU|nr:hypothetical protein NQ314_013564 [Rhamnusium bicolor]
MENKMKINDLVWAKIVGHPPWPSLIVEPPSDAPEKPSLKDTDTDIYWIYFFGSHNYAWVEGNHLKPYIDYKDKFASLYRTVPFKEAVAEIENILLKQEKNRNYKVHLEKFQHKTRTNLKRTKDSSNVGTLSKRPKSSVSIVEDEARDEKCNSDTEMSTTSTSSSKFGSTPNILRTKNITTSTLTFGVLGIGIIGSGVIKNLVRSGHKVNIWNRTTRKCTEIESQLGDSEVGHLKTYHNPRAVMKNSDIVFNCFSNQDVSKKIIQNYFGINNSSDGILNQKGIIEMTGIDPETSKDIRDMIEKKGGRYLEAQVQGSKIEAAEGSLVVLTAGSKSLFFDCQSCFKAIGKSAIFLGDVGYATKINLILQLIRGVCVVGLAEGLALAERCGVSLKEFLNVFNLTNLASTYLRGKSKYYYR